MDGLPFRHDGVCLGDQRQRFSDGFSRHRYCFSKVTARFMNPAAMLVDFDENFEMRVRHDAPPVLLNRRERKAVSQPPTPVGRCR